MFGISKQLGSYTRALTARLYGVVTNGCVDLLLVLVLIEVVRSYSYLTQICLQSPDKSLYRENI